MNRLDFLKYLNPIPIIREYREEKRSSSKRTEYRVVTPDELAIKTMNKHHSDGRIFMRYDYKGNKISHNVSPYIEDFLVNIEEGVKPLIVQLKNALYLTVSSCEGHGPYEQAFVTIAVDSHVNMRRLVKHLEKVPFARFPKVYLQSVANNNIISNTSGVKIERRYKPVDEYKIIDSLNLMLNRGYEDYTLFNIEVGYNLNHKDWLDSKKSLKARISYLSKKLFNIAFKKIVLKILTNRVKSADKYNM